MKVNDVVIIGVRRLSESSNHLRDIYSVEVVDEDHIDDTIKSMSPRKYHAIYVARVVEGYACTQWNLVEHSGQDNWCGE